jgi:hypothetical protein
MGDGQGEDLKDTVISSLTKEYIKVPVSATENGAVIDPTTDTVEMAFVAPGTEPAAGDWKTAEWETAGSVFLAKCLVGDTVTLSDGRYEVYVRVTDNPEIPVKRAPNWLVVT